MMTCCSWLLIPFLLLSGMATEIFGSRPGECKTERAMTTQVQCSQDDDCSAPKKCCPTKGGGARCEIPATNCHQLTCSCCKIDTITGFALCAVDGVWGEWGNWGSCSAACGEVTQERTRACDSPAPANGGADCVGESTESQACSTATCSNDVCTLTDSEGIITSRNYPLNYDNNLDCQWNIVVGPGSTIVFTFLDFELESDEDCISTDYVQVREYNGPVDPISTSCGSTLPSEAQLSTSSGLSIYFHTNEANTFRGFNATYTVYVD